MRLPVRNLLLSAAIYAFAGWLSHQLTHAEAFASLVWTPAGIALGVVLALGRRMWLGILLGACLVNYYVLPDTLPLSTAVTSTVLISIGACLQAWCGATLTLRLTGPELSLDTPPTIWRFLAFGCLLTSTISASFGTTSLAWAGIIKNGSLPAAWLTWWIGDSLGAVLIAPVALAFLKKTSPVWRQRRLSAAMPLLGALLIISLAYMLAGRFEREHQQTRFDHHAGQLASAFHQTFSIAEEAPSMLKDFYLSSGGINRTTFEAFAGRIHMRHPTIQALAWVPIQSLVAGPPDHGLRKRDPGGQLAALGERIERFPIRFIFPLSGNSPTIGRDLGAEPVLAATLSEARLSGLSSASRRIRLIESALAQHQVVFFAPVRRSSPTAAEADALEGYMVSIIDIGKMAEATLATLPGERIAFRIEDMKASPAEQLLYQSDGFDTSAPHQLISTFQRGGAEWKFTFAADFQVPFFQQTINTWPMLLGGMLFSIFLSAFLLLTSGSSARSSELVEERTREMEEARREAERASNLLREAVSSITQGFTIYDENDRLVICNETYLSFYETSRDLIVPGSTFEEIVRRGAERGQYEDAIGRVDEWVANRVAEHQRADGRVIEQLLHDGRWLMIVEHRTPSGFIAGNRIDITGLKRSAAAIEERNAQLDALFRLSPDGFVAFDQDGCVSFANPAFYRMTNIEVEEIVGHADTRIDQALRLRSEHPERFSGVSSFFGEPSDPPIFCTMSLIKPRPVTLQVVGIHSRATGMPKILYLRDITHETEVNRMKNEFLSHAAHELRTPMTSILGFTELLTFKEFSPDKRREILQTIHRQTRWLVDIVNELLDLARIEARRGKDFKFADVDLVSLVRETVDSMSFDRQIWPVQIDLPVAAPLVQVDSTKIRQALTNVISNAQKYSPDGGKIHIEMPIGASRIGIIVADQGIGMTPEQVARIGERFWRADASGKTPGTGLGMPIVKEIIELHGGGVEVSSTPGVGTTISLWLPIERHLPEQASSPEPKSPPPATW